MVSLALGGRGRWLGRLGDVAWAEHARAAGSMTSGEDLAQRLQILTTRGARPYGVVGDSHSRMLVRRGRRGADWLLPIWHLETGASARGLARPEARSGAGARTRDVLRRLLAVDGLPVLTMFGQVDIEFVHTFKRLANGERGFSPERFDAFADETVAAYVAFLAEAVEPALRGRVRVCPVFPPALSDAAWRRGYLNAHLVALHGEGGREAMAAGLAGLEIPDLVQRTGLHDRFNARLARAASAEGFSSPDLFRAFVGGDGAVRPAFLGAARGADHHLDFAATQTPVLESLWRIVDESGPVHPRDE
jgi:hypothetical protein